ncbi:hemolymph lipopolysaccharide-binding protein-like isoform X1 [Periplaneta americana]|uniref:hemolymph lipopolysaccharide-binding protein-like isoform X1 n=1 Tax=Periplaneta americana TaxID=6978 RepID=UPI0037E70527
MGHVWAFCLVTGVAVLVVGTELQCSAPSTPVMSFTITSRRNETGHWIAEVQMDHDASEQSSGPWELRVTQSTRTCEKDQTVRIEAVATVPPKAEAVAATAPSEAKPDYRVLPGVGQYKLHTTAQTWDEARRTCEAEGAHLLVLDRDKELPVIKDMFAQAPTITNSSWDDMAWVGVHDLFTEGNFVTVLGRSYKSKDFVKWSKGKTKEAQARRAPAHDDCVAVELDGELYDTSCDSRLPFFCEREF